MLRISIEYTAETTTLRLEGKLVGPWIPELEHCWRGVTGTAKPAHLIVDLNGVSWVDSSGRALLREIHSAGATLEGRGLLSQFLIHWIVDQRAEGREPKEPHVSTHSPEGHRARVQ
ncbi:MAG: STAS domain-containing protein [Terriglobales bacterium]